MGLDPAKDLYLRTGLFGGEGMTEPMRDEMRHVWGEQFFCTQNYGMSELCGPGVAGECRELCGMHVNEDWFIPEIIDPKTEEVLPAGARGELVVTCLGKEALPIVRYRTGDMTRLFYEPCKCGRTTVRMENLSGRADDMLVIRGVNVFPTQIEEVLLKIEEIGPHYEILVERRNRLDVMTITVELIDDRLLDALFSSEIRRKGKKNPGFTKGWIIRCQIQRKSLCLGMKRSQEALMRRELRYLLHIREPQAQKSVKTSSSIRRIFTLSGRLMKKWRQRRPSEPVFRAYVLWRV